jgi:hypothetical protein
MPRRIGKLPIKRIPFENIAVRHSAAARDFNLGQINVIKTGE